MDQKLHENDDLNTQNAQELAEKTPTNTYKVSPRRLSKTKRGRLYRRVIHKPEINSIFISQQILESGCARELYHNSCAEDEKTLEEQELVPGGFDQNKGRQAGHFHDCVIRSDKGLPHQGQSKYWSQDSRFSCTQC